MQRVSKAQKGLFDQGKASFHPSLFPCLFQFLILILMAANSGLRLNRSRSQLQSRCRDFLAAAVGRP